MVTYDEATTTLLCMFPNMELDVIDLILHQCHGHLERTVEVLLTMQSEAIPTKNSQVQDNSSAKKLKSISTLSNIINNPKLPDDFLRPPSYFHSKKSCMNQDQVIASILQDELFLNEIISNPSILKTPKKKDDKNKQKQKVSKKVHPVSPSVSKNEEPDEGTMEKLKNLGEAARIRLARMFSSSSAYNVLNNDPDNKYTNISSIELEDLSLDSVIDNKYSEKLKKYKKEELFTINDQEISDDDGCNDNKQYSDISEDER